MFQSRQRLYPIAQRYDFGNRKPQPTLACGTSKPVQDVGPRGADDWLQSAGEDRANELAGRWIDVEEHAAIAQQAKTGLDLHRAGCVVDNIEAIADLRQVGRAIIEKRVHATISSTRHGGRAAASRNRRPEHLCELNGRLADSASAAVDEHILARR